MFESVAGLLAEHEDLTQQLSDPALHADAARAKKVNRRYAELNQIKSAYEAWQAAGDDLAAAQELAREDAAFADEVPGLEEQLSERQERLRRLLIPRDPDDGRDVIMEIKGGEGGEESALFAADLLRMYSHYAETKGWKVELLERTESDLGGYKDVQVAIKSNTTDPSQGVWAHLKYEGGVHRVQRVPQTESQGRIHTSTTGVLVFPEVDEPEEVQINQNDLKIDVYRSSGPGGQSVNTTDSASASPTCPRASRWRCRTRSRSCRTARPACACSAHASSRGSRRSSTRSPRTRASRRSAGWTVRSASARTTSRRTGSRTTAPATRRTTSTA